MQKATPTAVKLGSITLTQTAEKKAALTLAVVSTAAPTAVKYAAQRLHQRPKTGSVYPSRSVKGGINSSKMGSLTPTPTAEKPSAFTLTVVQKATPTAENWAA